MARPLASFIRSFLGELGSAGKTGQRPLKLLDLELITLDRLAQKLFGFLEPKRIFKTYKGHGLPLPSGASRAAHPVHIGRRVFGKVKVHHKVDVENI
jgi:hypothetical protein